MIGALSSVGIFGCHGFYYFSVSTTSVSAFVASWVPDSYAGISSHYHSELLSRLTRYLGLHEFSADSNASTLKRCNDNS